MLGRGRGQIRRLVCGSRIAVGLAKDRRGRDRRARCSARLPGCRNDPFNLLIPSHVTNGMRVAPSKLKFTSIEPPMDIVSNSHAETMVACERCAIACDHCMTACLRMEDCHGMQRCIELCGICASVCRVAGMVLARQSDLADAVSEACAKVCAACADECQRHEDRHCQQCADACRACEEACKQIALGAPAERSATEGAPV